jgi:hypothetical protein
MLPPAAKSRTDCSSLRRIPLTVVLLSLVLENFQSVSHDFRGAVQRAPRGRSRALRPGKEMILYNDTSRLVKLLLRLESNLISRGHPGLSEGYLSPAQDWLAATFTENEPHPPRLSARTLSFGITLWLQKVCAWPKELPKVLTIGTSACLI